MIKFSLKKDTIIKILGMLDSVVSKNNSIPYLSNILIQKEENKISFIASDLDIGVSLSVPFKTDKKKEESFLIDPKVLGGVVSHAPTSVLELTKKDNIFYATQKNYSSEMPTLSSSEFPLMPSYSGEELVIQSDILLKSLSQVNNCLSKLEIKPELTGVLLNITKEEISLVSTDGFRLAEKKITKKQAIKKDVNCILPSKTVNSLSKIFQDASEEIKIFIDENQIFFVGSSGSIDICVVSSLIDASYPDYKNIIPKEFVSSVVIDKKDLLERIKGGGFFTDDSNVINLGVGKKDCTISVKNTNKGDFETTIATTNNGEEYKCNLNYTYLQDGLSNIEDKKLQIKFSRDNGPLFLQGEKTSDYIYLLMPIRA